MDTMVGFLLKPLIFEAALIWWRPLNYPMLTNIQKTHHLPWYFCSLPTIKLPNPCLSLDRHFQTLSKRILAIFGKREFGERNWATLCIENKKSELNSFGCDSLEWSKVFKEGWSNTANQFGKPWQKCDPLHSVPRFLRSRKIRTPHRA